MLGTRTARQELERRVRELEARLDHERLFPCEWANRRVRDAFGLTVRRGPFAGMAYPDWAMTTVDLFSAKLLGAFELELHDALEALIATRPPAVVNIGAAEGWYAIGLARRLPESAVHAFDTNVDTHAVLRSLAEHNGVADRITVDGTCEREHLRDTLADGALVLCDCEGGEVELLDPEHVPALRGCSLIVECHDLLVPGASETLAERFAGTHDVDLVPTRTRYVDEFPELDFLPLVTRQLAISEFRSAPMQWMVLRPRSSRR
jgi:predicted O-methyltransferase YrrM